MQYICQVFSIILKFLASWPECLWDQKNWNSRPQASRINKIFLKFVLNHERIEIRSSSNIPTWGGFIFNKKASYKNNTNYKFQICEVVRISIVAIFIMKNKNIIYSTCFFSMVSKSLKFQVYLSGIDKNIGIFEGIDKYIALIR